MKSVLPGILSFWFALLFSGCSQHKDAPADETSERPNFLILMSDNHSWNHVGCYGNGEVQTPNIDQIAKDGVFFTNAFCTSPSCSPARAAMLTGQDIWQLREAANLWGSFPKTTVYTEILAQNGYHVGIEGKGWGPGDAEASGWDHNPGGQQYGSFDEFYNEIEHGQPWVYWYSSRDPHRPYKRNGWEKLAITPSQIEVPPYLPDTKEVRKDIADYYGEIQNFDQDVGSYLALVKEKG